MSFQRDDMPGLMLFQRLTGLAGALTLIASPVLAYEGSTNFKIEPQTKLKVTIVEWIASTGEYKEWTALNGEYAVSSKGTISVPMIGELPVEDKSTGEVEASIAVALKRKTGLAEVPVATVEVSRYPMVYVTGAVDRSGEYEFRPGLTAMQAVALAGGRERRQIPTGGYSEVDQVRYLGELNRYQLLLKQLAARRARLLAEVNAEDQPGMPEGLSDSAPVDRQILADEKQLFLARTKSLQRHLDSLTELGKLLKDEIEVLDEKKLVQNRQVKIAERELKMIAKLVNTKAMAKTQESSAERLVADLRSGMLDLVVQSMRAQQKLSETERDALTLRGQYTIDARRDLQTVEAEIEDTKLKRDTLLQVLQITGASMSTIDSLQAIDLQPIEYWLTRGGQGDAVPVSQFEILQPRDVLEIRLGLPGGASKSPPVVVKQTQ